MAGKRDEVTIAEVAEALNISKTTVSRAISGKGRVSEATRARVFDYIDKGRQDAAAPLRTAQQGPTNNLALVIPKHFMRLDLPFLRKCMGGVWNMAAQRGYDLLLCYAGETDVGQLERQLESHKVDGVILSRTMLHDECVQTLQRYNVPFVAIGRVDDDKVPQVDNDQVGAGRPARAPESHRPPAAAAGHAPHCLYGRLHQLYRQRGPVARLPARIFRLWGAGGPEIDLDWH